MNIFASMIDLEIRSCQRPSMRRRTQCRSPVSVMIVQICQGVVRMRHTTRGDVDSLGCCMCGDRQATIYDDVGFHQCSVPYSL